MSTINRTCDFEGCGRGHYARGWCKSHYAQWTRRGEKASALTPLRAIAYSPAESLRVHSNPEGGCLTWAGSRNGAGYGQMTVAGTPRLAHRVAWEQANGEIPDGMWVDHSCHNRACVLPAHLRLATPAQNGANRGRPTASRTHPLPRNIFLEGGKFRVSITRGGVRHNFGKFDSLDEATRAAEKQRALLFGEFAGAGWANPTALKEAA